MNTAQEVREHALTVELEAIDFLDRTGSTAKDMRTCKVVRLRFIDGREFRVTAATMRALADFQFQLRPTRNDS